MKILYKYNHETDGENKITTFICELSEKEEEKVISLEFYLDSMNHPSNFVYSDMEAKYNDECLFIEYKTLNNLISEFFGDYTKICTCTTSIPGGYCCDIYSEKLMTSNLVAVHVTEYYNI